MNYREEHLGPKGAPRAMYDARPVLGLDDANRVLAKHHLGRAVAVESFQPYVINFVHKILRHDQPPVLFKGQYRPLAADSLVHEATVLRLLDAETDLPVPPVLALDEDSDLLDYPYLLLGWLDGEPSDALYDAGDPVDRCCLARQLGETIAAIHACPVPPGANLPVHDLRRWPRIVEDHLFAGDALHEALTRLAPDFEATVRDAISTARAIHVESEPVLTWRDASLHNTVAATGPDASPLICGVFDFQVARLSQTHLDLAMSHTRLAGRPWSEVDDLPPEWQAFAEGYGRSIDLAGPERDAAACAGPSFQVRHWWEILGHLHRRTPQWLDELLAALRSLAS